MKILSQSLILLILFASCSEGRKARLRASDITGIAGLETEEFVGLKEYAASSTNTFYVPKDGQNITVEVEYKNSQLDDFIILDGDRELRCRYEFNKATLSQEIAVETMQGDEAEITSYNLLKVREPIEPTYAGVPYVKAEEEICNAALAEGKLIKENTPVIIDLAANHTKMKAFINRQIIEVFDACSGGTKVDGSNCLGANVQTFLRTPSPVLVYKIVADFEWMAADGSRFTTNYSLEFSPTLISFAPTGLLNLSSNLMRPIQSIDLPYKSVSLLEFNLDTE
jgi:hypothetical protein